ncbi:major facilitator superfamily domain-containing protein [Amanita rubescens]|nr:major facilitator superfamily domain-containing protein [Amanita rubescens]
MDFSSCESEKKGAHRDNGSVFRSEDVDVAAHLAAGTDDEPLDPKEAARLRRKIDMYILPLMCSTMTFADKISLGQAAVLGILFVCRPSVNAHLNRNQFNWLGTIFYLSYLAFEYPQNLALQRFPIGKWMSINVFVWAVALLAHAACNSFGSLFAVRFILGACEGAITPGFMLVTAMFYTRDEQSKRVGYWFLMNGFALIFLGFVSFGVTYTKTPHFAPWKWLMIIIGLITLVTSVVFWFFFPDSPANAYFLTPEERVLAIRRIKVNQAGVENKHWKKAQFVEALTDPKTYLLALFAALSQIFNSITNQRQIIVKEFGFNLIQTTLLGCVDGVVEIIAILVGITLVAFPKFGRAYTVVVFYLPATLGTILVETLPFKNKIGLLFSYWVNILSVVPLVVILGWTNVLVAGHTKRTTVNAILLVAYGLGNAVGPLMWELKYAPRNRVPWSIIAGCNIAAAITILILRIVLARENIKRDTEERDYIYDDVYIKKKLPDGTTIEAKVDKAFLDLTDKQNRDFRYVL